MKKHNLFQKAISLVLCTCMIIGGIQVLPTADVIEAAAAEYKPLSAIPAADPNTSELPGTTSHFASYEEATAEFLSVTGFASLTDEATGKPYVNDRSAVIGTDKYRLVKTADELVKALSDASSDKVDVIEIAADLDVGFNLLSAESQALSIAEAGDIPYNNLTLNPNAPTPKYTNPIIERTGVTELRLTNIHGLTVFSRDGNTLKHSQWVIQDSCSDIVIRNLRFDSMWQFDDVDKGNTINKETGWAFVKINGADGVWLDHCYFGIASDGAVDIENGGNHVSFTWCDFGAPTDPDPEKDNELYVTIMYLESLYQKELASKTANPKAKDQYMQTDGRYYLMRQGGATPQDIIAYEAYHHKGNLVGSGDKDWKDDVDNNKKNGNQNLHLTIAYTKYTNVGSRVPMIRQGTGHLINVYHNNYDHMVLHQTVPGLSAEGVQNLGLNRGANPRDGAVIGADTCVYYGVNEPMIGDEYQGQYIQNEDGSWKDDAWNTANMMPPWGYLFKNAVSLGLIVNSRITPMSSDASKQYKGETYTGNSWSDKGNNPFRKGWTWRDYSSLYKWSWQSGIANADDFPLTFDFSFKDPKKATPEEAAAFEEKYSQPFSFAYTDPAEDPLPYSYVKLPLDDVTATLDKYAGPGTISMSAEQWASTTYKDAAGITDADQTPVKVQEANLIVPDRTDYFAGEEVQLVPQLLPAKATDRQYSFESSDPSVATVSDLGRVSFVGKGNVTITMKVPGFPDQKVDFASTIAVTGITLNVPANNRLSLDINQQYDLIPTIVPDNATDKSVKWSIISGQNFVSIDNMGRVTAIAAGTAAIRCTSVSNPTVSRDVRVVVSNKVSTDPTLPPRTETPATTEPSVTTAPPATTEPPVTTAPPATTAPPVTTAPPATTAPPVTTAPPATTEPPVTTAPPATTEPPVTTAPPATTEPPVTYLKGDADCNGTVSVCDAVMILRDIVRSGNALEGQGKTNADVNGDNKINTLDAVSILKYVVHNNSWDF